MLCNCRFVAAFSVCVLFALPLRSADPSENDGVLGQRYFATTLGVAEVEPLSGRDLLGSLTARIPVVRHLDITAGYQYEHSTASAPNTLDVRDTTDAAFGGLTVYIRAGRVRPFVAAGFTRSWTREHIWYAGLSVADYGMRVDFWNVDAGAEFKFGRVVVTPACSFSDRVHPEWWIDGGFFTYSCSAHLWISRHVGGFTSVGLSQREGDANSTWGLRVGTRWRL